MTDGIDTAANAKTEQRSDPGRRLHSLMYMVFYPAVLGSFLFGLFSIADHNLNFGWGILLVLYFALQQIEGTLSLESGTDYKLRRFLTDFVEVGLMVLAFEALGLFPSPDGTNFVTDNGFTVAEVLVAVFLWPVGVRVLLSWRMLFQDKNNANFYWSLTVLSGCAALASCWWESWAVLCFVFVLLLIYAACFQIWNEKFFETCPSFLRFPK